MSNANNPESISAIVRRLAGKLPTRIRRDRVSFEHSAMVVLKDGKIFVRQFQCVLDP